MSRPLAASAAALGICLTLGGRADAQTPAVHLDYQAPAGCPDPDAFTAEVRARAPRSASLGGRTLAVTITTRGGAPPAGFEGRVLITDESGVTPSRAVHGDTCADVVRALALTVAMTLDPEESTPPVVIEAVAPPAAPAAERPAEARPAPEPSGLHIAAGVRGGAESAVGPLLAPAFGIYGDLAGESRSVRVGAVRAVSPLVERGAGAARFARTTATLDACPFRWRAAASVAIVPCATFAIGSSSAEGRSTVDPESVSRLWAAVGVGGRLAWEPVRPLVFELEGRATVPLTRDRFFFRPSEDVYEPPILAVSAGLTAGVRFR